MTDCRYVIVRFSYGWTGAASDRELLQRAEASGASGPPGVPSPPGADVTELYRRKERYVIGPPPPPPPPAPPQPQ